MKANWFRIALIEYLVLLLVGCTQVVTPALPHTTPPPIGTMQVVGTQTAPVSPTEGDTTHMTLSTPSPSTSGLQSLIEKAKGDLARRLSISVTQISLVDANEVVWPDGSLGCPEPGMAYAQSLTPGYLILLKADNNEFEYHASRDTYIIYCANPTPPIAITPEDI